MVRGMDSFLFADTEEEAAGAMRLLSEYMEERAEDLYKSGIVCDVCSSQLKDYIDSGSPKNMINLYVPKVGQDVVAVVRGYLCSRFGDDFKSEDIGDADSLDVARLLLTDFGKVKAGCAKYVEDFCRKDSAI